MNIIRHKSNSYEGVQITEIVLELCETMMDSMRGQRHRNSVKRIEDSFLVACGHIVYAIAARRNELNDVPIERLIENMSAAVEINAMELHVATWKEKHGQKP